MTELTPQEIEHRFAVADEHLKTLHLDKYFGKVGQCPFDLNYSGDQNDEVYAVEFMNPETGKRHGIAYAAHGTITDVQKVESKVTRAVRNTLALHDMYRNTNNG